MKNIFFIFLFSAKLLSAQDINPVSWKFSSEKNSEGQTLLHFTAEIEKGWAVYSQFLEEGGPIPTSIHFEEIKGCEVSPACTEEGEKIEGYDEMFAMEVVKFKKHLELTATVKPGKKCGKIKGYLEYMCCDESRCLPPKQVPFQFDIKK